jgi:hypothetical protein
VLDTEKVNAGGASLVFFLIKLKTTIKSEYLGKEFKQGIDLVTIPNSNRDLGIQLSKQRSHTSVREQEPEVLFPTSRLWRKSFELFQLLIIEKQKVRSRYCRKHFSPHGRVPAIP